MMKGNFPIILICLLLIIGLISGCASKIEEGVEETPKETVKQEVVLNEPVKVIEPVKKYEFKIISRNRDDTNALCSIVSHLTNFDSVTHRFSVNNSMIIDNVKTNFVREFNLESKDDQRISEEFECPDNKKYFLNASASLIY